VTKIAGAPRLAQEVTRLAQEVKNTNYSSSKDRAMVARVVEAHGLSVETLLLLRSRRATRF
jgi:hypothetical protein